MDDDMYESTTGELPLLAGIAAFLRWLEELIVLVSGPLLMAGLGIGLVALLSDGALSSPRPGWCTPGRFRRRWAWMGSWWGHGIG